jgi:uncharacterized damage-inducible protein DinB
MRRGRRKTTDVIGHNAGMTDDAAHQHLEQADLLQTLTTHRGFLRRTLRGLSDEDARRRSTASELCLGGIVKHVALVEEGWADFIAGEPEALAPPADMAAATERHLAGFRMDAGDTVDGLLGRYAEVAARTDDLVRSLPSLDASRPLPPAPWFEPGAWWSARRVLLHIIAETAQHAGHADIIRESIDGSKTMG